MIKNVKQSIESLFINKYRKDIFNDILPSIDGKYYIDFDKVICQIDKDIVLSNINLNGLDTTNYDIKNLNELDINKPIYYYFKNVSFLKPIHISSIGDVHVIFQNCKFNGKVNLTQGENFSFRHSKYSSIDTESFEFNASSDVNHLSFLYDEMLHDNKSKPLDFQMNIDSKNTVLLHSRFYGDIGKRSCINISSQNVLIYDTDIDVYQLMIHSQKFKSIENNISSLYENIYIEPSKSKKKEKSLK